MLHIYSVSISGFTVTEQRLGAMTSTVEEMDTLYWNNRSDALVERPYATKASKYKTETQFLKSHFNRAPEKGS